MVLINGAGNTTVVFLSTPNSTRLCKLRSYNAGGCAITMTEAPPERGGDQRLTLRTDDLRALLPNSGLGRPWWQVAATAAHTRR